MRASFPADWRGRVVSGFFTLAMGKCEEGANDGPVPRYCQAITGNAPPDFYCMSTVCRVFERTLRKASPLVMTGSCEQQRVRALKLGALRTRAEFDAARAVSEVSVAGWIFLNISTVDGKPHAHHTGIVGNVGDDALLKTRGIRGGFLTCEGNAADPKKSGSRDGDGIYSGRERGHADDHTTYAFIDPAAYPLT